MPLAPRARPGSRALLAVALLVAGPLLVACGSGEPIAESPSGPTAEPDAEAPGYVPEAVQELDVVATDYTFTITPDASTPLTSGWTELRLRNDGAEAHQIMFARIKDGVDMAEMAKSGAGDSSGAGAIEFVDMLGGVSYIGPGNEIKAMVNLPEGIVLAMCYVPDAKGVAHALMGMTTALTVEGPDAEAEASKVELAGTIEMSDEGYAFPDAMPAGWYRVANTDTDDPAKGLHELALLELDRPLGDGEEDDLVAALAANEKPTVGLNAVGGMGALTAGFDGYLYLDLAAAPHLAADFMPDPGNPRPHMLDGYRAVFEPR